MAGIVIELAVPMAEASPSMGKAAAVPVYVNTPPVHQLELGENAKL
jgi:hypothetical protein